MREEKRFSVNQGAKGCLTAMVFLFVVQITISLVFNTWLGLMSTETEKGVMAVLWLCGVCLGGYFAARFGKTTGWTNSLVVGLIAEFVVYNQVPKGSPEQSVVDPLLDLMKDPSGHWRILVALALTMPAAILGGVLWENTGGVLPVATEESEKLTRAEGPEK
jgi:hypothetical protein